MPVERRDVEHYLEVGAILILHTDPNRKNGPRHKTILRGWRKGAHLLLDRPKTETGMFAALQEGQPCVFRFIYDGLACAFDASVIEWDTRRHNPYLRVQWPQEIQYLQFRRYERVHLRAEAVVTAPNQEQYRGEIRDLSTGGCGFTTTVAPQEGLTHVTVSFELPDGVALKDARALVRNVRATPDSHMLGLEFEPDQESVQNDIGFYVTSTLSRTKGGGSASPSVLIIDPDEKRSGTLRRGLDRQNIDAFVATNVIDGLHRLRTIGPEALLVCAALREIPGREICRIVRSHEDFGQIYMGLYGGEQAKEAAAAAQLGIAYFPETSTMGPDVAFQVGKALRDKH